MSADFKNSILTVSFSSASAVEGFILGGGDFGFGFDGERGVPNATGGGLGREGGELVTSLAFFMVPPTAPWFSREAKDTTRDVLLAYACNSTPW